MAKSGGGRSAFYSLGKASRGTITRLRAASGALRVGFKAANGKLMAITITDQRGMETKLTVKQAKALLKELK